MIRFVIVFALITASCQQFETNRAVDRLVNLEGTWCLQGEGKILCEQWMQLENGDFAGVGFEVLNGDTLFLEELKIERIKNKLSYSALVYLQNDGNWIHFDLRTNVGDVLIFENKKHDFPKQIRLQFQSAELMNVYVLGDDEDGFSHQFTKQ